MSTTGCRDCAATTSGRCAAHSTQTFTVGVIVPAIGPDNPMPLRGTPFFASCVKHPAAAQTACAGCLAALRARLDCGLTDAEREASPNRGICRTGAAEAAANPHGDGRDCAACNEWDADREVDHLRQTWTRVEKERDEARAQAAAETARVDRLFAALRSAHDLLTTLYVHVNGLGPVEKRVGEEQARTAAVLAANARPTDALAQHDAALLAPVWAKVRASGIGDNSDDLADAVAQVAQVAVSARDNCVKMEALLDRVRPVIDAARSVAEWFHLPTPACECGKRCGHCRLRVALATYDANEKGAATLAELEVP